MKNIYKINQNIYITNDEEIKEGYVLHLPTNRILKVGIITELNGVESFREKEYHINGIEVLICDCKKIILTKDKRLIKDGVQAIDDEFLEWFCKNSSCEEVEVEIESKFDRLDGHYHDVWEIILPKEEPKQETIEEAINKYPLINQRIGFKEGVKWQQEQDKNKYSEEEVIKIVWESRKFFHEYKNTPFNKVRQVFYEWFEQFKKK